MNAPVRHLACPVCGHEAAHFAAVGSRANGCCPGCGAYERHRLIASWLHDTGHVCPGLRLLDVAPMPGLSRHIAALGAELVSIDLGARPAMARMRLERLAFADASFDAILCVHVLEHVADDASALAELHRVLKPGGWAVLMVPFDPRLAVTDEDPAVIDPRERARRFGQHDHLRSYGADYPARCARAGFRIETVTAPSQAVIARHALLPGERMHVGWKGAAR